MKQKTFNTIELAKDVQNICKERNINLTEEQVKSIIYTAFSRIVEKVRDGRKVRIKNFGSFEPVTKAPRKGRNPSTGKNLIIPARDSIKYKISPSLHEEMNQGSEVKNADSF